MSTRLQIFKLIVILNCIFGTTQELFFYGSPRLDHDLTKTRSSTFWFHTAELPPLTSVVVKPGVYDATLQIVSSSEPRAPILFMLKLCVVPSQMCTITHHAYNGIVTVSLFPENSNHGMLLGRRKIFRFFIFISLSKKRFIFN